MGEASRTDQQGSFSILVPKEHTSQYSLHARDVKNTIAGEYVLIDSTTKAATLTVQRIVKVAGKVILPEGWAATELKSPLVVGWAYPGESNSHPIKRCFPIEEDGHYEIDQVAVGEFDLVLRHRAHQIELLRWGGLFASGDGPVIEVEDWKIQGQLQRLRFEVRRPEGAVQDAWVSVNGGSWPARNDVFDEWVTKADRPLLITCYDCRRYETTIESIGNVVTLSPAFEVDLNVTMPKPPHALSGSPLWFRLLRVRPEGSGPRPPLGHRREAVLMGIAPIDEEGKASISIGETGTFTFEFWSGTAESRQLVDPGAPPKNLQRAQIKIVEGPLQQTFTIGAK